MRHFSSASRCPVPGAAARLAACALLVALAAGLASAQTQSATAGTTPSGAAPGSPSGSYALSGFDTVNPYNGGLNFRLPLLTVAGRGGARVALGLRIEQRWTAHKEQNPGQNATFWAEPSWWSDEGGGQNPLGAGRVQARKAASRETPISNGCNGYVVRRSLTRLTFTAPDGTEYELVDANTGGETHVVPAPPQCSSGFNRGRVFITKDGTAATFIAEADVVDAYYHQEQGVYEVSGQMLFADGTRYGVKDGDVKWLRDRNGNLMTFAHDTYGRLTAATDSLRRKVTVVYAAGTTTYDEIRFNGFGGAARTIRINHVNLSATLRAGFSLAAAQFPELNSGVYNPKVVNYLELPDGRRYNFRYNNYAELARVELPTGGAVEYDHAAGLTDGAASGVFNLWNGTSTDRHIYRRVVERRVYAGGGTGATYASKTTYGRPESASVNLGYVDEDVCTSGPSAGVCGSGAALLARTRHHYRGSPRASFGTDPIGYRGYREGREYWTEEFASDGATVLRRLEQMWQQPLAGHTWPLGTAETDEAARPNDPQVTQAVTTLADTGHTSKQAYAYDQYNNRTDTYDYDYGAGAPGWFLRRTHTDYVTAASYVGASTDPSLGAHLRRLPSQTWVSSDAAGNTKVSRAVYEYDNYAADARHAALLPRSPVTGLCLTLDAAGACVKASDANFHARGNVTGVTSYADAAAQADPVTVSTQYDVAGNPVKVIDARGHHSSVGYSDSFCNGPGLGCGGASTPNTYAFPTSTTSPVPDPSNTYGSSTALTTSTRYDFWTGLAYSATDANSKATTYSYADPLDRPTAVVGPDGSRTDFAYGDAVGNLYVRTQSDLDATRRTDSYRYFDRLGRPFRAISYENQDAAKPWVTQDTEYDALGRVRRASLPYRAAAGAALFSTDKWAETGYDSLGRVTTVTTKPDNAVVTTSYLANQVTVTDQALKARRSVTDPLGRLVRVDEPNAAGAFEVAGGLAQPTYYNYDASGNLRKVTQGSQLRFFMYDSLGRLTRAKNPEQAANPGLAVADPVTGNSQWSLAYTYDGAGNLLTRTDARGVTTTYTYDPLNRNGMVTYSDATPDVTRYYDLAALGKGRAWKSEAAGVARTTVPEYDAGGRPKAYSQQFWVNNAWGASYGMTRVYDEAGNVTSQTYPSGRGVSYSYDRLGRPASSSGNLGDSVQRAYVDTTLYDELGGRGQERFGTGTPLYSKRFYNERGQLEAVRVGTQSITSADPGHWNRGAILNVYSATAQWTESGTDNNGNLRKQMLFVPNGDNPTGGDGWWESALFYEYDSLNRLDYVREAQGGQSLWRQDFDYDRWGNRTVNAANTQVFGASPAYSIPEPQFAVNAANNRLSPPSGYTMSYDLAGNLTSDTYTGQGTRSYDAEGRMISAQFLSGQVQIAIYTYDADGRRVKRVAGAAAEVWQVYGAGGELLAEYAAGAPASSPLKEYGYRGGELLVIVDAPQGGGQAHDAVSGFSATQNPSGAWAYGYRPASGGSFTAYSATPSLYGTGARTWAASATSCCPMATKNVTTSDYAYAGAASIVQPPDLLNLHPGPSGERSVVRWTAPAAGTYVVSGRFQGIDTAGTTTDVLVRHNSATLFSGAVSGYGARVPFSSSVTAAAGDTIEFSVGRGSNATYSNDSTGLAASVVPAAAVGEPRWLVSDHLGTPRMVVDQTGSLSGVTRHDYLPFGEELTAGVAGRTEARGYIGDGVRQKFTSYERDSETSLDYTVARRYSPAQGRFTSPDPFGGSGHVKSPQSWNRYTYCLNRPLVFTDPLGLMWVTKNDQSFFWVEDKDYEKNEQRLTDEGYRIANGAIIQLASVGANYSQYKSLVGGYVRLNESGTLSAVPDPGHGAEVADKGFGFTVALGTLTYDGDTSHELRGPPGGHRRINDTIRWYDEDGYALLDIDHHTPHGTQTRPHMHWWGWTDDKSNGTRSSGWEPVPDGTPVIDTYDDGIPVHNPFWSSEHPGGIPITPMFRPAPGRPMMPLRPSVPLRPILVP